MRFLRRPGFVYRRLFAASRRLTPFVAAERDGAFLLVSTEDSGYGRSLFLGGGPDLVVFGRALAVLRHRGVETRGSTLVDVGANIGSTAIPAVLRHGFGRAVAFEPDPDNVRLMRASVALNGLLDRVLVVEAAVAEAPGTARFGRGPRDDRGRRSGIGSIARASRDGTEVIDVDAVVLDGALAEHGIAPEDVGLLWIDTQGHEGHVLTGAISLLARRVPVVLAVRPAKLRRPEDRARLDVLVAAGYDTVVDLRRSGLGEPRWRPEPEPIASLLALVEGGKVTDALFLAPPLEDPVPDAG